MELVHKSIIYLARWLAHVFEHIIRNVLRRDPELSADVVFQELTEECVVLIRYEVIEPYSRTDKHLLNARQFPQLSQQIEIPLMTYLHIFTRLRIETVLIFARPRFCLLCACEITEIRRRSAHVMYIPLKIGIFNYKLCFSYQALVTS